MEKPWITGPKELLNHGFQHLSLDSDFDNRIAMISIDNSVELMIKTFLGLPKRISKIENLNRKKYEEISSGFPSLLDGLEEYASDKLTGIELGDIEWFHRLRNQLYHDGNGVTVEKSKVEMYAEVAKILFENLFGIIFTEDKSSIHTGLMGEFIQKWADVERNLIDISSILGTERKNMFPMVYFKELESKGLINRKFSIIFDNVKDFRNKTVHGMIQPDKNELKRHIKSIDELLVELRKLRSD